MDANHQRIKGSIKGGTGIWTSGLDHDDMADFTGEDSAMGFYS
jgi:hypothetical protein